MLRTLRLDVHNSESPSSSSPSSKYLEVPQTESALVPCRREGIRTRPPVTRRQPPRKARRQRLHDPHPRPSRHFIRNYAAVQSVAVGRCAAIKCRHVPTAAGPISPVYSLPMTALRGGRDASSVSPTTQAQLPSGHPRAPMRRRFK